MKTQSSVKSEPFLLALMESEKVWGSVTGKGCEFRLVNRGNLPRPVCSHSSWCSSLLGTDAPSSGYGEGTSHEALMTCFRRRSESFLHKTISQMISVENIDYAKVLCFGGACTEPHQC